MGNSNPYTTSSHYFIQNTSTHQMCAAVVRSGLYQHSLNLKFALNDHFHETIEMRSEGGQCSILLRWSRYLMIVRKNQEQVTHAFLQVCNHQQTAVAVARTALVNGHFARTTRIYVNRGGVNRRIDDHLLLLALQTTKDDL